MSMKMWKACAAAILVLAAAGAADAAAIAPASGLSSGRDAGPLIAAILALALIAQGGRRRLRM